jgi:DNA-binding transcriptional LysR family regulator
MEDRLIKFARIVDAGSFTRAAGDLHISQPALTTAVKKLERELHAELLIRSGHGFRLTEAGQIAYRTASSVMASTENLRTELQAVSQQKILLNLGMIDSLATMLFVQGQHFTKLEQGTKLSLTIDNSSRLTELVSHNEIDTALVARPQRLPSGLQTETLGIEPLVLVVQHQLADQVQQQMNNRELRLVMSYNQTSHTHQIIAERFTAAQIELAPTFYSTSPEIMLQLALAGRGAAVLPYLLVKNHLESGVMVAIRIGASAIINRQIISLRRKQHLLSIPARQVLAEVQNKLEQLQQETAKL